MSLMEHHMSYGKTFLIVACLAVSACQISNNAPKTQAEFLQARGLTAYKNVTFLDADGKSISYEKFSEFTKSGRSFSMMKNPDAYQATLTILDADSQPATNVLDEPKLAISPGQQVPLIKSTDLAGNRVTYSEKPTLISFFFAECGPCIKEVPQINSLMKATPEVQWVSLTFDERSLAEEFAAKYPIQTRIVSDEQEFIDAMGVKSYPLYALIGKDGRLLGTLSGATLQIPLGETIFKRWIRSKIGT